MDLAVDFLTREISTDGAGGAGWGWVPDVPPNPQNTAEVVCALRTLGREVPQVEEVFTLVCRDAVKHHSQGAWAFDALIDVAWRLRALRWLDISPDHPAVLACAASLVQAQDDGGGWRLAGAAGEISITATAAAVRGLHGLAVPDSDVNTAVRDGVGCLIASVLTDDVRSRKLHAAAQIADLLARSEIAELGGPQTDRAREIALKTVMDHLDRDAVGIEEETFTRGAVTDRWRHMTLHLGLLAASRAAPDRVFDPSFRRGFANLLALQECAEADNVNLGGFRTSREGFVTSYATTQALEVLAEIDATVSKRVNAARTFDLVCRLDGAHHTDPQDVVTVGGRNVSMNSWAGLVLLVLGTLSGGTTAVLAVVLENSLGEAGSRGLVVWGAGLIAVGVFGYLVVRLPATSNGRIAAAVFTAFTALVIPVVTFLLS